MKTTAQKQAIDPAKTNKNESNIILGYHLKIGEKDKFNDEYFEFRISDEFVTIIDKEDDSYILINNENAAEFALCLLSALSLFQEKAI